LRVPNHSPLGKGTKSCLRSEWFAPIFPPLHKLIIFFQGRDPIAVWVALRTAETAELADFALTILKIVVNQAGCEHVFSDLKVKQTQRRNRLKLEKLDKMTKVSHPPSLFLFRIRNGSLSHVPRNDILNPVPHYGTNHPVHFNVSQPRAGGITEHLWICILNPMPQNGILSHVPRNDILNLVLTMEPTIQCILM
jgi:hypothetical protein